MGVLHQHGCFCLCLCLSIFNIPKLNAVLLTSRTCCTAPSSLHATLLAEVDRKTMHCAPFCVLNFTLTRRRVSLRLNIIFAVALVTNANALASHCHHLDARLFSWHQAFICRWEIAFLGHRETCCAPKNACHFAGPWLQLKLVLMCPIASCSVTFSQISRLQCNDTKLDNLLWKSLHLPVSRGVTIVHPALQTKLALPWKSAVINASCLCESHSSSQSIIKFIQLPLVTQDTCTACNNLSPKRTKGDLPSWMHQLSEVATREKFLQRRLDVQVTLVTNVLEFEIQISHCLSESIAHLLLCQVHPDSIFQLRKEVRVRRAVLYTSPLDHLDATDFPKDVPSETTLSGNHPGHSFLTSVLRWG